MSKRTAKPNSEQCDSARIPNIAIPKTIKFVILNEVGKQPVEMNKQIPFALKTFSNTIKLSTNTFPAIFMRQKSFDHKRCDPGFSKENVFLFGHTLFFKTLCLYFLLSSGLGSIAPIPFGVFLVRAHPAKLLYIMTTPEDQARNPIDNIPNHSGYPATEIRVFCDSK